MANPDDTFDKLAQDIANAGSPFELSRDWNDIKQGFNGLAMWKANTTKRLNDLEAKVGTDSKLGVNYQPKQPTEINTTDQWNKDAAKSESEAEAQNSEQVHS